MNSFGCVLLLAHKIMKITRVHPSIEIVLLLLSLLHLARSGLVLQNSSCPIICSCDLNAQSVSCKNRSLTELPDKLPLTTQSLDLSKNHIQKVLRFNFASLVNLEFLDLAGNGLESLEQGSFFQNGRLKVLNLNHNQLDSFPASSFGQNNLVTDVFLSGNRIHYMHSDDLITFQKLSVLDLSRNKLHVLPDLFFDLLPNLEILQLGYNNLFTVDMKNLASWSHGLQELNLEHNSLEYLEGSPDVSFPELKILNLNGNNLSSLNHNWFVAMPNLTNLFVNKNPLQSIPANLFYSCPYTRILQLCNLTHLGAIGDSDFAGLHRLNELRISGNKNLSKIGSRAFGNLSNLISLDLSNNSLVALDSKIFEDLKSLRKLNLSGNHWACDCRLAGLRSTVAKMINQGVIFSPEQFLCSTPASSAGLSAFDVDIDRMYCTEQNSLAVPDESVIQNVTAKAGSTAVLHCPIYHGLIEELCWTKRNKEGEFELFFYKNSSNEKIHVRIDGGLWIENVDRDVVGYYYCIVGTPEANSTSTIRLILDAEVMRVIEITSLIIAFSSAAGFLAVAILLGALRYCCYICSRKERKKRKSMREVLRMIRSGSQIEKLSSYKTAKMEQFSAFRSATMDHLSAFKTAKIGKLRTYKQMTVTSVLHYLERMREHYSLQTAKIKENCVSQVEKLRENYSTQKERLKDHRSQHVRKIRDNYNSQAVKIREYGTQQVSRLLTSFYSCYIDE